MTNRRHPDFAWAWISRLLVQQQIFLAGLVLSITTILTSVTGGRLSDTTKESQSQEPDTPHIGGRFLGQTGGSPGSAIGRWGSPASGTARSSLPTSPWSPTSCLTRTTRARTWPCSTCPAPSPTPSPPAVAPLILLGGGSYAVLFAVAGSVAILGGLAILPVRRVR